MKKILLLFALALVSAPSLHAQISSPDPQIRFHDTDCAATDCQWRWRFNGSTAKLEYSTSGVFAGVTQVLSVTTSGTVSTAESATKLDDKVCHASQYSGTSPDNTGGKIRACFDALPATGGTVDALGLEASGTFSTDIWSGVTKPITLLIGAGTYTSTMSWSAPPAGSSIVAMGSGLTAVNFSGAGFFIDKHDNAAPSFDDFKLIGLRINVSGAGSGCLRVGDRSQAFGLHVASNERWRVQDVLCVGSNDGTAFDITHNANSTWNNVRAINFDTCYRLSLVHQSDWASIGCDHSTVNSFWYDQSVSGATPAGADGLHISALVLNGVESGNGIFLDSVANVSFNGVFIEASNVTSAPTVLKLNQTYLADMTGVAVSIGTSPGVGWAKMLDATDSFSVNINDFAFADLNSVLTSTVTFGANYNTINERANLGNITCRQCSYQMAQSLRGQEGVVLLGPDRFPGSQSAGNMPLTGVTDLYSRTVLNRQGIANVADTNFVLDAFHGQSHYDSASTPAVVTDANASKGKAVQIPSGAIYGFEIPYPSEITLGAYELIGRVRLTSGTGTGSWGVVGVGGSTITSNNFATSWTTSYQTFSIRFALTSANMTGATALRAYFNTSAATMNLDYLVLRPAANDVACQPYVRPDDEEVDSTAGMENGRISCATAIPTSGRYHQGDFVFNLSSGGDHTTVPASSGVVNTVGWVRLTTGTVHAPGTDWAAVSVPRQTLVGVASLDFAAWSGISCQDKTITVLGVAAAGFAGTVVAGIPNSLASTADVMFGQPWVSGNDTVTIRGCKVTAGTSADPAAVTVVAEVKLW